MTYTAERTYMWNLIEEEVDDLEESIRDMKNVARVGLEAVERAKKEVPSKRLPERKKRWPRFPRRSGR